MTTVSGVPLDPALARKLSRASKRVEDATAARDALIREAMDAGGSSREVAELVGLSHTQVIRIAKR